MGRQYPVDTMPLYHSNKWLAMSIKAKVARAINMLEHKGFQAKQHVPALFINLQIQKLAFQLQERRDELDGKMHLDLFMNTDQHMQGLYLECYSARWVPAMALPRAIINGIDTTLLQRRMDQIDWHQNGPRLYQSFFSGRAGTDLKTTDVLTDLFSLGKGYDPQGMHARDHFIYNFLLGTGIEWYIDCQQVKQQFEITRHFHTSDNMPHVTQAALTLRQSFYQPRQLISVRRLPGVPGRASPPGMHH
ncbi:hypothetical protein [Chitinophaga sp. YIM B06452]|uniref:hypothetical protein n=1 Tax=Chitinophaga sp. YIM B06452 TaxID=3082158 RepID=UPI0031FE7D60